MLNDRLPRIPRQVSSGGAGGRQAFLQPRPLPVFDPHCPRVLSGPSEGGQAEACFPWVSIVTLRAIEGTCSNEDLCLNLRSIDDEKFETVGFPGPTAGAGGGYVISPWAAPIGAAYRFPSRCAAGAAPRCSAGPSQCGIPSCLLAPVLPVLLRQAEDGLAVVVERLLGSIFAIFG